MKKTIFFCTVRAAVVFVAVIATLPAESADVKAPFELESSLVLPRGVRNPRFKNLFMAVDSKFNGSGKAEPLGQKLNKVVQWADVLASQPDETQKNIVRGLIQDAGLSESGSPGSTSGVVNTYANVKVPVLAVGITERLTLAAAIPVMHVEVSTDTGFIKSADGETFVNAAAGSSPVKGEEAAGKLNDAVNQKLKRLGYESIRTMNVDGVGDIKLVSKYNAYKTDAESFSVKADVTLPTGSKPNVDRAVDVPTGDGQYDVGLGVIYDRQLVTDLRWNAFGAYVYQSADKLERRLPISGDDSLSSDKELVSRNLGDQFNLGTSLSYVFPSAGVTIGGGYNFQYQTQTTFTGKLFSPERYRWLEELFPLQALHSATMTAGFSTVEWFKQKKFVYPFQANLAYSLPLSGRNVTTNNVVMAELVLFF